MYYLTELTKSRRRNQERVINLIVLVQSEIKHETFNK